MKGWLLAFPAVFAMMIFFQRTEALEVREYVAISHDQGNVKVNMGRHDYCALSTVASGGFNSGCGLWKEGEVWVLVAVDPGKPDPWVGESQTCKATCFSLKAGSVSGGPPPPPVTPLISLAGRWAAYRGGSKVADCSILQDGTNLTFIIHRSPEERSRGQLLSVTELVASDWGPERGNISPDGRRIDWPNSYWISVSGGPPPPPVTPLISLAGRWAGYRGGSKVADCSILQDGANLTFIIHRSPEERSRGQLLSTTQVVASDWGNKGTISPDGRRIDWGHAHWIRVD